MNLSVSPKLRKQLAVEQEQLKHLLEVHRPLIEKCATISPDPIELSALAAMLHAFYSGIENMFKRITVESDEAFPEGGAWHRQLIVSMTKESLFRPAVISHELGEVLEGYLEFRHVFRHAYPFQLSWLKMAELVRGCEETFNRVEHEIEEFIEASKRE